MRHDGLTFALVFEIPHGLECRARGLCHSVGADFRAALNGFANAGVEMHDAHTMGLENFADVPPLLRFGVEGYDHQHFALNLHGSSFGDVELKNGGGRVHGSRRVGRGSTR